MAERTNPQADIIVGAQDQATPVFDKIRNSVENMARAVEQSSGKAGSAVGQIGEQAETSSRATKNALSALARAQSEVMRSLTEASGYAQKSADGIEYLAKLRNADVSAIQNQVNALRDFESTLASVNATQREAAASSAFDKQHQDAKKLVQASEYVNMWANALDILDAKQREIAALPSFERELEAAQQARRRADATVALTQALDIQEAKERELAALPIFERERAAAEQTRRRADAAAALTQVLDRQEAAERKLSSQNNFLANLTRETEGIGKTRAELVALQAAQLGVADKAAPLIAKLREQETLFGANGKSAKEMQAALRGVPAQITDIVVSLQGGQAPITVLLQQGGQLKDMFGGVVPAAKALGGALLNLINPYTLAAAAVAGLGFAMASVNSKDSEMAGLAVRLSATGRGALSATGDIKAMIEELNRVPGVSRSAAASIIDEFSRMQGVGADIFKGLGASVADFAAATGTDIPTAAKKLGAAFADPAKGAKDLEVALGTLSAEQLLTIEKMAALGDKAGAQAALLDALQKATKGLANDAMTPLGKATDSLSNSWDGLMKSVGNSDALHAANVTLSSIIKGVTWLLDNAPKFPTISAGLAFGPLGFMASQIAQGAGQAAKLATPNTGVTGSWTPGPTPASELDNQVKDILEATTKYKSTGSEIEKVKAIAGQAKDALAELEKQNRGTSIEAQALRDRIGGLNEELIKLGKRGQSGAASTAGQSELASLRARGTEIQRYIDALKSQGLEADKQTASEKLAAKYREELNGGLKGAARATKELQLAQAEKNAGLEKEQAVIEGLLKAQRDFEQARTRETASRQSEILKINETAQALEDEAAAYGLGKQALEALRAERRDEKKGIISFFDNPEQVIKEIDDAAAAAKRLSVAQDVIAGKKFGAHTDELLANAKEQASLHEDELKLTGLTALERAKIVAQRQVEIKYAKELEKLNDSKLSEADKTVERQKIAEAKQIAGSAAVAKVVQDDWAKTAEQINQSLTDALMRGFESGKSFALNLRDTLVNMFKTMVLRPRIEAGLNYASGALGLTGSANAATGGGGLSGVSNMLGLNSGWLSDFGPTLVGKIASTGADLFSKGFETIGKGLMDTGNSLSRYSDVISGAGDVLGYGGALYNLSKGNYGAAIGGAIGTYFGGPIGAAIGSALGGLFDGDGKPASKTTGDTTAHYDAMGNRVASASAFGLETDGVLQSSDTLRKTYGDVAKSLGIGTVATSFGTGGNSDGETTHFAIGSSAGGKSYQTADNMVYSKEAYDLEASRAILSALQGSELPKELAGVFDKIDIKSATQDQITTVLNYAAGIKSISAAFEMLPLKNLHDLGFSALDGLSAAAGGLDKLSAGVGYYYENFYSESERNALATQKMTDEFAKLGIAVPENEAAFRTLLESIDVTTPAGQQLAVSVGALAPAFKSASDAAVASAQRMSSVIADYATPGEVRDFEIERIRQGLAAGGVDLTHEQIAGANRQDARALWEQFNAQAKAGNAGARRQADAVLDQAAAFAKITENTYAKQTGYIGSGGGGGGSGGGGASGTANPWKSAADAIVNAIKDLQSSLLETGPDSFARLQAQFAIDLARSRAGDVEAAQGLPALAKSVAQAGKDFGNTSVEQAVLIGNLIESMADVVKSRGFAVPGFATGTNYVPQDMLAVVHKGEAIIPSAYNPANGGQNNAELVAEIRALREEVSMLRASASATATATQKTARTLDQAANGGQPIGMVALT